MAIKTYAAIQILSDVLEMWCKAYDFHANCKCSFASCLLIVFNVIWTVTSVCNLAEDFGVVFKSFFHYLRWW